MSTYWPKTNRQWINKVKYIALDDNKVLRITVLDPNNKEFTTIAEFLHSSSNPDIGRISTSISEYRVAQMTLQTKRSTITSPYHYSLLQEDLLNLHHWLFHLPFSIMLYLSTLRILTKRFFELENDLPPCVLYKFGKGH